MTDDFKNKFKTLNLILRELRTESRVTSALAWAHSEVDALKELGSDLLFSLHYAEFTQILSQQLELCVELKVSESPM